jgi:shikimate dehydrogenase
MWVDGKTELYAVIGSRVEHSLSPTIQNAAFRQLNLNCVYMAFSINPNYLSEAVRGLKIIGVKGFNVTMPYKVAIMPLLNRVDALAKRVGAVNTVKNNRGSLVGYNTDGDGFLMALDDEGVNPQDKKFVVIGAGGAARAITFSLAKMTEKVVILNRTEDRADELSSALSRFYRKPFRSGKLDSNTLSEELEDCDVLVNATSVGMHPDVTSSPVSRDMIKPDMTIFDIVYSPLKTRLLRDAEIQGAKTISGIKMLVYQALKSFEIWTGKRAPAKVMLHIAMKELERSRW